LAYVYKSVFCYSSFDFGVLEVADCAGWHVEDIKAGLRKKHGTIRKLAASWGLAQPTVSAVFCDAGRSMRVERLISETLGVPLHELWPDRWHPDGTPKPRPRAATYTLRPTRNSQKQEAA
jgi:Ner family transcriptional regulator